MKTNSRFFLAPNVFINEWINRNRIEIRWFLLLPNEVFFCWKWLNQLKWMIGFYVRKRKKNVKENLADDQWDRKRRKKLIRVNNGGVEKALKAKVDWRVAGGSLFVCLVMLNLFALSSDPLDLRVCWQKCPSKILPKFMLPLVPLYVFNI